MLYGYPLDGVVLTIGCDKTTPALLMAAATVNIPAIALSVGPMLNGWFHGERTGSGTIVWKARELLAKGEIDYAGLHRPGRLVGALDRLLQHHGHRDDDELAGRGARHAAARRSAAIPAPYRDRQEMAWRTGKRIVEMVHEDLKPSDIMTKDAFINAIRVNSAIGGSTNAPIHLNAIARHLGRRARRSRTGRTYGEEIPLLVNLQPAGEYLGEDYYHAGGVPAVFGQLIEQGLIDESAMTVERQDHRRELPRRGDHGRERDPPVRRPAEASDAGFLVLTGNLFHSAVMKMSVISPEFRDRYLSNPDHPEPLRGPRRRLRRAGGLPPPDRRPEPRDRREHAALHARRRARWAIRARPRW